MELLHKKCIRASTIGNTLLKRKMVLQGSFTLLRSRAERSNDRNKATAVTTKLQRSNALICFTEHTSKRIENATLLRYA